MIENQKGEETNGLKAERILSLIVKIPQAVTLVEIFRRFTDPKTWRVSEETQYIGGRSQEDFSSPLLEVSCDPIAQTAYFGISRTGDGLSTRDLVLRARGGGLYLQLDGKEETGLNNQDYFELGSEYARLKMEIILCLGDRLGAVRPKNRMRLV